MKNQNKKSAKEASLHTAGDEFGAQTGCCQINYNGQTNYISNITAAQCAQQAGNFPGATYQFSPAQACPGSPLSD